MIRIDELIAEHCPDGVIHKPLGDVGAFIRGNGLQKSDLTDEGAGAIHYGQLHTHYGVSATVTKSFVPLSLAAKLRRARTGDLVIATTSEDDAAVAKATAWLGQDEVAVSGDAYIFRHSLDARYVAYFFQSEQFQSQKIRYISGTKVRRISGESLGKIRIPTPPLEVQREIVRILDHFTELEAELEAELSLRRQLRAALVYRLLSSRAKDGARMPIGSFATRYVEPLKVAADVTYRNLGVKWYGEGAFARAPKLGGKIKATMLYRVRQGQFIYNRMFVTEGSFGLVTPDLADGVVSSEFPVYDIDHSRVMPEWLYLRFQDPFTVATAAAQTTGGTKSRRRWKEEQFEAFVIEVPPLETQRETVQIAQSAEGLEFKISEELSARRKQHEYYRDRLLTFKELAA